MPSGWMRPIHLAAGILSALLAAQLLNQEIWGGFFVQSLFGLLNFWFYFRENSNDSSSNSG